ncbi:hypothetical protein DL96DRAFT_99701 [Flagelloscypha sp. PMI_526]|nr:hypothetical protein DL96DRAFT_99701 [Flagelloscypha sp. PMI_526]
MDYVGYGAPLPPNDSYYEYSGHPPNLGIVTDYSQWSQPSNPDMLVAPSTSSPVAPQISFTDFTPKGWQGYGNFREPHLQSPTDTYDSSPSPRSTPLDGFNTLPPHSPVSVGAGISSHHQSPLMSTQSPLLRQSLSSLDLLPIIGVGASGSTSQLQSPLMMTQSPPQPHLSSLELLPVPLPGDPFSSPSTASSQLSYSASLIEAAGTETPTPVASTAVPSESVLFSQSIHQPEPSAPSTPTVASIPDSSAQTAQAPTAKAVKRKKPPIKAALKKALSTPRLSQTLAVSADPNIRPYCSKELFDHVKDTPNHDPTVSKPYKCGLEGCDKSYQNVNGLQYHLQVSTDHFRDAIHNRISKQLSPLSQSLSLQEGSLSPSTISSFDLNAEYTGEPPKYFCSHETCQKDLQKRKRFELPSCTCSFRKTSS